MYLKLMSGENKSDGDSSKCHIMVEVVKYDFFVDGAGAHTLSYTDTNGEETCRELGGVFGNVYVMNNDGKTINSFRPPADVGFVPVKVLCEQALDSGEPVIELESSRDVLHNSILKRVLELSAP